MTVILRCLHVTLFFALPWCQWVNKKMVIHLHSKVEAKILFSYTIFSMKLFQMDKLTLSSFDRMIVLTRWSEDNIIIFKKKAFHKHSRIVRDRKPDDTSGYTVQSANECKIRECLTVTNRIQFTMLLTLFLGCGDHLVCNVQRRRLKNAEWRYDAPHPLHFVFSSAALWLFHVFLFCRFHLCRFNFTYQSP